MEKRRAVVANSVGRCICMKPSIFSSERYRVVEDLCEILDSGYGVNYLVFKSMREVGCYVFCELLPVLLSMELIYLGVWRFEAFFGVRVLLWLRFYLLIYFSSS